MRIKKDNDEVIETEINYGRMGIILSDIAEGEDLEDIYKCNTCGKDFPTNDGEKSHLSQMRREMIQSYGLICPYCVGSFSALNTINSHIRNKIRK